MHRILALTLAIAFIAPPAQAADGPRVVQTDGSGTRVLLTCSNDEMPVYTEGPSDEIVNGQVVHSDHGLSKCVAITQADRAVPSGGSGTLGFTGGRIVAVEGCADGTVPLVWQFTDYKVTISPSKPSPHYIVTARILARCIETSDLSGH